jgi:hypothetical protein
LTYYLELDGTAYTRRLVQGISLNDKPKIRTDFRRWTKQAITGKSKISREQGLLRVFAHTIKAGDNSRRSASAIRLLPESKVVIDNAKRHNSIKRMARQMIQGVDALCCSALFSRKTTSKVRAAGGLAKSIRNLIRALEDKLYTFDTLNRITNQIRKVTLRIKPQDKITNRQSFLRNCIDAINANSTVKRIADSIRWLCQKVFSDKAAAKSVIAYRRKEIDTAMCQGLSLRRLAVHVRLISKGIIQDLIIRRFIHRKNNLVIKSPVCREILLESRVK